MRQSFRDADFTSLVRLWNSFYPARYATNEHILRLNTVLSPVFDWGASAIEVAESGVVRGFVIVKRSAVTLYKGPDRDQAHLSALAYSDPLVAIDLLGDAKSLLRNRGISRVTFGQDSRHFFPGCPTDFRALLDFLTIEGFAEGGESHDVERDLGDYVNPYSFPTGVEYRMLGEADFASLDHFLRREFPGRWHYDVTSKVRIEGIDRCVFGMLIDGEVEGFALIQDWTHKVPIGGAVWSPDLGENWGALGPIGLTAALRGGGRGGALLGGALSELHSRGVRQTIIDWTSLLAYYGKHGFEPTRTYKSMALGLD